MQVKDKRDATGGGGGGATVRCVDAARGHAGRRGARRDADKHATTFALHVGTGEAGIGQGKLHALQQQSLLRVHRLCLGRRNPKEAGVEEL